MDPKHFVEFFRLERPHQKLSLHVESEGLSYVIQITDLRTNLTAGSVWSLQELLALHEALTHELFPPNH